MKIFLTKNIAEINGNKDIISPFLEKQGFSIETEKEDCDVVLDFVTVNTLGTNKEYWKEIAKINNIWKGKENNKDSSIDSTYNPKPIITIGMWDLMSEKKDKTIINLINIDRRYKFLGSSIWNYYVSLENTPHPEKENEFINFNDNLKTILDKISVNYELELYSTNVAQEFIEFQTRIMTNSNLIDIDGHAKHISPFVFHSERNMKILADKELKKIKGIDLKWRLLLIDDFANKQLGGIKNTEKTKKYYIRNILKNDGLIANENDEIEVNKNIINIDTSENIELSLTKINEKIYDIILLDYLLGYKNGQREYGHKFITEIEKKANNKKNGLLNRYWIFPISSFSTAMIDKIRERGIGHLYKHWYIPRGADPINTPELFRYNLYRFMNLQISEFSNSRINTEKYSKDYLIDIIKDLFKPLMDKTLKKDKKTQEVDKIAVEIYPELILIHSRLQQLKKDEKNKSRFAKSVRDNYYKSKQEKLWQHVLHLFYLLSSHGYLKSPEMWKELNSIKQTVDKPKKLKNKKWYKNVNNYIAELYNKIN